jgi:hypothetical protein
VTVTSGSIVDLNVAVAPTHICDELDDAVLLIAVSALTIFDPSVLVLRLEDGDPVDCAVPTTVWPLLSVCVIVSIDPNNDKTSSFS